MRVKLSSMGGFSLLEGTMSILILGIGLLGVVSYLQNHAVANANSDYYLIATKLAEDKVEEITADNRLQSNQYDYITGSNYTPEFIDYRNSSNFFYRTVTITEVDSSDLTTPQSGSGLKKIDVDVRWGYIVTQTVTLSTVVAEY